MIQLTEYQLVDLERLATAIAASFYMKPRAWISHHGGISHIAALPKEYKQLISDYKDTKQKMESCLK